MFIIDEYGRLIPTCIYDGIYIAFWIVLRSKLWDKTQDILRNDQEGVQ